MHPSGATLAPLRSLRLRSLSNVRRPLLAGTGLVAMQRSGQSGRAACYRRQSGV